MRLLSINEIATDEHVSRQAIQQRLDMIEDRLPASWGLVFGPANGKHSEQARQQLYPLPQVRAGQELAANRMVALGMPGDLIVSVTGIEVG